MKQETERLKRSVLIYIVRESDIACNISRCHSERNHRKEMRNQGETLLHENANAMVVQSYALLLWVHLWGFTPHPRRPPRPAWLNRDVYKSTIPFSLQIFCVSSSHKDTCTSPMCALPSSNMESRDCPIPPPIVRGSSPESNALWKGSVLRSLAFAFVSCSSSDFSSTRIPMDEISNAQPRISFQKSMSPFRLQSS